MLAFPLVACGEEKEDIHDVDYYVKNFDECKKQVEKCESNPGKLEGTPNCKNAKAACYKRLIQGDDTGKMTPVMEKSLQEWRTKKQKD